MSPHVFRPLAASIALIASAFALLAIPGPSARAALPTEEVSFASGSLDWGFANRWRCYVVGMISRGEIEVSDGAEKIPGTEANGSMCNLDPAGSEAIRFPITDGYWDPTTDDLFIQTAGTVRFRGHATLGGPPQLDTTFTDISISAQEDFGTLTADVTGATQENPEAEFYEDLPIVDLDLSGVTPQERADGIDWSQIPATLSSEGVQAFGSYEEGEPFDPVSLTPIFGEFDPDPEPEPEPDVKPAQIKRLSVRNSGPTGLIAMASVRCPGTGPACQLNFKKLATVKVGRKVFPAPVMAPRRVAAGEDGKVQVRLPRKVKQLIKGRAIARVSFPLTVDREGVKSVSRQVSQRVRS